MNNWQSWQIHLNRLRVMGGQPSWVTRIALLCAGVIIAIPLLVLVLAALVVGAGVFVVLAGVAAGMTMIRSLLSSTPAMHTSNGMNDDGRQNVRVIRR